MPQPLDDDWARNAEAQVLDAAVALASEAGWNEAMAERAAKNAGLTEPDAELLLPKGALDLAALLMRRHDEAALSALNKIDAAKLKVRERIHAAVEARLDAAMADEAATKACSRFLAHPRHAPLALRLGWETADKLWRWAGDEATDENHYSKRAILGTILASTLAVRLTSGQERARKHLGERIDQVMAFEKWKAVSAPRPSQYAQAAAEWLGRWRYGARTTPQP